jgi:DNA polymerase III delta prime subunit
MPIALQNSLRHGIENLSGNCRFLLTANNLAPLTDAMKSRCIPVSFNFIDYELEEIKEQSCEFYARRCQDLGINFDANRLRKIVKTHLPDYRAIASYIELEFGTPQEEAIAVKINADAII